MPSCSTLEAAFNPIGHRQFQSLLVNSKIGVYLRARISQYLAFPWGPVAQLIERVVRNDEVVGLIPIRSTIHADAKDGNRHNWLRNVNFARDALQRGEINQTRLVHWPRVC